MTARDGGGRRPRLVSLAGRELKEALESVPGWSARLVELAQQISALAEPAAGSRSKLRAELASHALFTSPLVDNHRIAQETHGAFSPRARPSRALAAGAGCDEKQ